MSRAHLLTGAAAVAATYATREGWHVFPCVYGTKIPLRGSHGHLDATTELAEIAALFGDSWRTPNIAVSCAPSGIVVVDVDVRNGGDETLGALEHKHGPLPHTPRVLSGSGDGSTHYYFSADAAARYPIALGPGVDVKHAGGYVLLPPSRHASGRTYRWDLGASLTDTTPAPAPTWMTLGGSGASPRPAIPTSGPALATFLGVAFSSLRWLGPQLPGDRVCVRCPWADLHTDHRGCGDDSSTVLLPPVASDHHRVGRFRCAHAHCERRRAVDVIGVLPKHAIAAAAAKHPRALGTLAWRSARARLREVGR